MNKRNAYLLAAVTACLLAACGGGGNDSYPNPPTAPTAPSGTVPPSAWASVVAYVSYIGSLMITESGAPLNVDNVVAPTSETATPMPVN